ncbi:MAG TPA: proton-conducting transporter membrane subunit [Nocardioidaceae bacterium]|nr:proton-conducting transporter membrane subunit [Nocardioidaceae bacterium]
MAQLALWVLVLLPALVGGALALSRAERVAVAVSLGTATVTAALSVLAAIARPSVSVPFMAGADFALGVDALSALVVPAVAVVTLLVLIFSAGEITDARARFHGLMLLFASAVLVTATAETLVALLLAWEVMGATSYALIGFWWREDHRVSAGLTAFVTTRTADLGLYLAAGAALAGGAGLALGDLPDSSAGWRDVVAAGVLVAALGKAAQLPFSFWLSRAMEGPSPVSALLHSAAMVAMGGYLLLRTEPLLASTGWAAPAAAWAGAATALVLGAVAVGQRDLKQLLAASTSAQLGFVVMGAGLASVSGGAAHLVAHASTKALLFLAAGAWLTALGTKSLTGLQGVARRWRLVGWCTTVGALSLAGVAPLALWATKDAVLAAALEESLPLYLVGMAAAALSAAYAGKILVVVWRRVPGGERSGVEAHLDEEERGTRNVGTLEKAPLVVLAAGAAVLGLLALPPVGERLATALGEADVVHATAAEMAVSAVIALLVLGLMWRRPLPEPRWALEWLGVERAVEVTVVRPTLWLAERLARFDDRVLDRAVDATSRATVRVAEIAAGGDDRRVDGAVEWVSRQVRALGAVARRPQTGQLHQYYIQAVAVLAVGVLLLVTVR